MIKCGFYKKNVVFYCFLFFILLCNVKLFATLEDESESCESFLGECKNINIIYNNHIMENIDIYKKHPLLYCEETIKKEAENEQNKIDKLKMNWSYFTSEIYNGNHLVHKVLNSYINLYEYVQDNSINNPTMVNYLLNQAELLKTTYNNMNSLSSKYINNILNRLYINNEKLININQNENIWERLYLSEQTHQNFITYLKQGNINIDTSISTNIQDNILIIEENKYLTPNFSNKYKHQCGNNIVCILLNEELKFKELSSEIIRNFTDQITLISIRSQFQSIPELKSLSTLIESIGNKIATDAPIINGVNGLGHFLIIHLRETVGLVENIIKDNRKYILSLNNLSNMEKITMFNNKFKEVYNKHLKQYEIDIFFETICENMYSSSETLKCNIKKVKQNFEHKTDVGNKIPNQTNN